MRDLYCKLFVIDGTCVYKQIRNGSSVYYYGVLSSSWMDFLLLRQSFYLCIRAWDEVSLRFKLHIGRTLNSRFQGVRREPVGSRWTTTKTIGGRDKLLLTASVLACWKLLKRGLEQDSIFLVRQSAKLIVRSVLVDVRFVSYRCRDQQYQECAHPYPHQAPSQRGLSCRLIRGTHFRKELSFGHQIDRFQTQTLNPV